MTKIYAELIKNDSVVTRKFIGGATLDENGTVSSREYQYLKLQSRSQWIFPRLENGESIRLVTLDGQEVLPCC